MIQWMVLTLMTAVAAGMVASPFIRRLERSRNGTSPEVEIYKDQLKEIERDAQQGVIDSIEADAARAEVKRRLLAILQEGHTSTSLLSGGERAFAAFGVTVIVVGGAVCLYALTGDFERSDTDFTSDALSERAAPSQDGLGQNPSEGLKREAATGDQNAESSNRSLPSVDEMIERVVKRLDVNPRDMGAWRMLGWSYFGVERYKEAAEAYGRAIELSPDAADLRSARAEALIRAASGTLTPDAKSEIEEALRLDPKDPRARYFLGVAKEQGGDKAGALADWKQLAAEGDPNEPFILELRRKLAAGERPGAAQGDETSSARRGSSSSTVGRGPTAEDVKQAEAMSAKDRMAMIRDMVDTLAERLEKSPHDVDGWIKLIRSRAVLQEKSVARAEFSRALKVFEGEPAERDRIAAIGEGLGLSP
jgi:cytochrome c-type biogenesis protein CcmH